MTDRRSSGRGNEKAVLENAGKLIRSSLQRRGQKRKWKGDHATHHAAIR
ncbi:hypothetical protein HH800_26610 (plasmid) [Sphingobium yanoikuyae]|jgi:hypothetical protein|uniref:Uncharacterized protein n=1 Tax=Sphingobium yanoikuyae TaxID=13690 RepID=A0A6M4GEU3_SPHYA|nr:hypothetical protein [Sphingobium yanoikuyae]QJR05819.1 hypothetical protein HH800_26610 [Sphingobium yanoikuyae]